MIAPIRPLERPTRGTRNRKGVDKARRWIARSLLTRAEEAQASLVSSRAAWCAAAWMTFVAAAYFGCYVVERFGRD